MGQEFLVLRCYQCNTFQVHPVKKTKKWTCKMCGEKQSHKKIYGQGSGADCRRHVQKLNLMRGEVEEQVQDTTETDGVDDGPSMQGAYLEDHQNSLDANSEVTSGESKWGQFIENPDQHEDASCHGNVEEESLWTTERREFQNSVKERRKEWRKRKWDLQRSTGSGENRRHDRKRQRGEGIGHTMYKMQDKEPNNFGDQIPSNRIHKEPESFTPRHTMDSKRKPSASNNGIGVTDKASTFTNKSPKPTNAYLKTVSRTNKAKNITTSSKWNDFLTQDDEDNDEEEVEDGENDDINIRFERNEDDFPPRVDEDEHNDNHIAMYSKSQYSSNITGHRSQIHPKNQNQQNCVVSLSEHNTAPYFEKVSHQRNIEQISSKYEALQYGSNSESLSKSCVGKPTSTTGVTDGCQEQHEQVVVEPSTYIASNLGKSIKFDSVKQCKTQNIQFTVDDDLDSILDDL